MPSRSRGASVDGLRRRRPRSSTHRGPRRRRRGVDPSGARPARGRASGVDGTFRRRRPRCPRATEGRAASSGKCDERPGSEWEARGALPFSETCQEPWVAEEGGLEVS